LSHRQQQDKSFTIFIFYLSSSTFEDILKDPFGSWKTQKEKRKIGTEEGVTEKKGLWQVLLLQAI